MCVTTGSAGRHVWDRQRGGQPHCGYRQGRVASNARSSRAGASQVFDHHEHYMFSVYVCCCRTAVAQQCVTCLSRAPLHSRFGAGPAGPSAASGVRSVNQGGTGGRGGSGSAKPKRVRSPCREQRAQCPGSLVAGVNAGGGTRPEFFSASFLADL